jgi:hypothetical protein
VTLFSSLIEVFVRASPITVTINETTPIGTGILDLTVTDTDFDTILDFGISSGNERNAFAFRLISNNLGESDRTEYRATGQLSVAGPLDYERKQNYTLTLFAFDTQNSAMITVIVNLLPQNNKAPIFTLMPGFKAYEYEVLENTSIAVLNGPMVVERTSHLFF